MNALTPEPKKRRIDGRQRADCGAKPSNIFTGKTSHWETRTRSVFQSTPDRANLAAVRAELNLSV
jgi:hypothetical protein